MCSRESREGSDDYAVSSGDDSEHGRHLASNASAAVDGGPLRACWWGASTERLEAAIDEIAAELDARGKADGNKAAQRAARQGKRGRKALYGEDPA